MARLGDDGPDALGEDRPIGDDERAEATILAQALLRGQVDRRERDALPVDALETAALLRHSHSPELPKAPQAELLAELLVALPERAPAPARSGLRWLFWLLPAAAGVAIFLSIFPQSSSEPVASRTERDLLAAQAALLASVPGTWPSELRTALDAYRSAVLDAAAREADPDASAAVSDLREAHRRADTARSDAELGAARDRLASVASALVNVSGPSPAAPLAEAGEDAYLRLAELEQRLGNAAEARRWAAQGLRLTSDPSAARAMLWLVKAQAEEALGESAQAAGSLSQALEINETLMEKNLEGEP